MAEFDDLRVAILSDRDLLRLGLQAVLRNLAPTVEFVTQLHLSSPAHVVVIDATDVSWRPSDLDPVMDATAAPVVVLTAGTTQDGREAWDRPVHGFISTGTPETEVVQTVLEAMRSQRRGKQPEVVASRRGVVGGLSQRELAVMTAIAEGMSNHQIAESLFLGINTVKTYIRTAYRKIGVTSRSQAVIWAFDNGLAVTGSDTEPEQIRDGAWFETPAAGATVESYEQRVGLTPGAR